MSVIHYDLDQRIFAQLNIGANRLNDWQGAASGIADYVANWGVERFWAMSRSSILRGGITPNFEAATDEQRRYFAWGVARIVLCQIIGGDLQINDAMTTEQFQERFRNLNFNQQVLLTDLLIEISETIQFWTMRIKDAQEAHSLV
jgi:hypothetical protein